MNPMRRAVGTRRNDRCVCGSGKKHKYCCHPKAAPQPTTVPPAKTHYIDTGESAVRYVICDGRGTSFFVDKTGRILVFQTRADAIAIATLDEFNAVEPGEINVAGVGQTKWAHLQEKLPFVEVTSAEEAIQLVRERMEVRRAELGAEEETPPASASEPETA